MTPLWAGGSPAHRKQSAAPFGAYVGESDDGIHWAFIRLAQESVASLSVVPLQDVLGLRQRSSPEHAQRLRRKLPLALSTRIADQQLAEKLAALAAVTDRLPSHVLPPPSEDFAA